MCAKSRAWMCLAYPESMPEDIWDRLESCQLRVWVSPLHDQDVTKDGSLKKPHYHVIYSYDGPATYASALEVASECCGAATCLPCRSLGGAIDYLTHRGSRTKHVYSVEDIRCYGGASLDDARDSGQDQLVVDVSCVLRYSDAEGITSYRALVDAVRGDVDAQRYLGLIIRHAFFFRSFYGR